MIDASLKRVSLFLKNLVNAMSDEQMFQDIPRVTTPDIDDLVTAIGCLDDAAAPDPDEISVNDMGKECWTSGGIDLDELGME